MKRVAPLYRDAYFQVGDAQSNVSLRGLLPGESLDITIPAGTTDGKDITIVSPHILPTQKIEFEATTYELDD